jgi:hypothetical protein
MIRAVLMAVMLALGIVASATAGSVNDANGIAIKGYDPVGYFTDGRPVPGSRDYAAAHEGATFLFASARNRDLFLSDPAHYAPQYGGFCAFGTAQGYKADTQPEAFTIVGDRLYLNYNLEVRDEWSKDIPGYVAKADASWPTVKLQTDVMR